MKKVKVLSTTEREKLDRVEYLQIEKDFHDSYAERLNWDLPINDNLSYEDESILSGEVQKKFCSLLGNVKGLNVLDIGSGHGNTALNLAKMGAIVTSIDISPRLIEGCKYRAAKNNLDVHFLVMDATNLEFEDESFDIIVGFRTIHHLPDLTQFFNEAHRCLKPKGFILLVEPQKYNPFVEFGRRFIRNNENARTPTEHPIVPKDIKLLKKIFGNIEADYYECLTVAARITQKMPDKRYFTSSTKILLNVDNLLKFIPGLKYIFWQVILKASK